MSVTGNISSLQQIRECYFKNFRGTPLFVKAPGRINLAGEHLDYNMGMVLPAAINRYVWFAVSENHHPDLIRIYSVDKNDYFETNLNALNPLPNHWSNYLSGVVDQLQKHSLTQIKGFDCVFGGNLPQGAGLSSSAAVECGLALALNHIYNLNIDRLTLAQLCMKAEHQFAGVQCGLLDQFGCLFGKKNHAVAFYCKTLQHDYIPITLENYSILLFNSNLTHSLAENDGFNKRVNACKKGASALNAIYPEINFLCDATLPQLIEVEKQLDNETFKRCRYIVEETERFENSINALKRNDLIYYASILNETHEGLSTLYEISCPEIETLIQFSKINQSIAGAKLMGGGYGGCTLNIVKRPAQDVTKLAKEWYSVLTGLELHVYEVELTDAACILQSD